MDDLPDLDLRKTVEAPPAPVEAGRTPAVWIAAVVALATVAGGIYYLLPSKALPPERTATRTIAPAPAVARPLGGEPEAVEVPPLDKSDPVVRSLVRALSSAPPVVAWLTTNDLIRNFTVVVANIADGATPRRMLPTLRPSTAFQVEQRGGGTYVDRRSYARYDTLADAVASIDPAGAARVYATLRPRIAEAYGQLGPADPSFDHTLARAVGVLLRTPIVDGPVALVPKGIGWAYANEQLESLTAAQKQLVRMGPRNGRIIDDRLRAIAAALGIPATQLPAR